MRDGTAFGGLLRRWRAARRMSQLDLSLQARISSRHVSFLETGRAQPSRAMVLGLCGALDVPLRDRNALFLAAGFAPAYRETDLSSPEAAQARWALRLMLRRHEPFASVAYDRHWNVLMANRPWLGLAAAADPKLAALPPCEVIGPPRPNLLPLLFDNAALRESIENFEEVASTVLARVERELLLEGGEDDVRRAYLDRPELRALRERAEPGAQHAMVIPLRLRLGDASVRLISTMATLGTAQDVTLQELRIESFYPADAETEQVLRSFAATST